MNEHLGTQNNRGCRYDYFADENRQNVYQCRFDGATRTAPVWFCSFSAWERTMHTVCNA